MSTRFNWFKEYKIHIHKGTTMFDYDENRIEYIGGGDTSHSGGNIGKCQNLLEKYFNKRIPTICADFIHSEDEDLYLIEPSEMSMMCEEILRGSEVDEVDMRDRFEWFKKLSDEGYYLSYDYE